MSIRHGQNTSDDIDYNSDDFSEGETFLKEYGGTQQRKYWCNIKEHSADGNSGFRNSKTIENVVDAVTDNSE